MSNNSRPSAMLLLLLRLYKPNSQTKELETIRMRKYTTEYTVYTFDELSPEAQANAIERERQYVAENDLDYLTEDLAYKLQELLKAHGLKCDEPKIYYDLGYSQGSGAMFEGTVYYKAWRADIRHSGHYYHYNSKSIDLTSVKADIEAPDATQTAFNELYVAICQELEKYGYELIEYAQSDEVIKENIYANDYEFFADGTMA